MTNNEILTKLGNCLRGYHRYRANQTKELQERGKRWAAIAYERKLIASYNVNAYGFVDHVTLWKK